MKGKDIVITGVKIGAIMVLGSLAVSKVCKKSIEYYRTRNKETEQELIFEEESI